MFQRPTPRSADRRRRREHTRPRHGFAGRIAAGCDDELAVILEHRRSDAESRPGP